MAEGQDRGIEQRLKQAYREERRWYNIRGASRLTLWLIALLAVAFLIDWGLFAKTQMSGITGLALLLVNVGILIWVYHREWGQYRQSYDPLTTGLEVEKRHPELSSLLVSYMQLKDDPKLHEGNVSQDLIKAMRDQAIEFARPIDFKDIVDLGQLRKIGAVAVVLFVIFSIAGIFNREHTGVLFQRLLGQDAEYPTNTVITRISENLTIRVGGEPVITATVAEDGKIPESGRLFIREKNSSKAVWREVPMKRSDDPGNEFSFKLKPVDRDTQFYVKIGDDRSEEYTICLLYTSDAADE